MIPLNTRRSSTRGLPGLFGKYGPNRVICSSVSQYGSLIFNLLGTYGDNDDVVFFLGWLVWQRKMMDCAPSLAAIAIDPPRGRYARIAAIRGVVTVGDAAQKNEVWETIANDPGPLDRSVLAELIDWAAPTARGRDLPLCTLDHAAPFERFHTIGLDRALHVFIDRPPVTCSPMAATPMTIRCPSSNWFNPLGPGV